MDPGQPTSQPHTLAQTVLGPGQRSGSHFGRADRRGVNVVTTLVPGRRIFPWLTLELPDLLENVRDEIGNLVYLFQIRPAGFIALQLMVPLWLLHHVMHEVFDIKPFEG